MKELKEIEDDGFVTFVEYSNYYDVSNLVSLFSELRYFHSYWIERR